MVRTGPSKHTIRMFRLWRQALAVDPNQVPPRSSTDRRSFFRQIFLRGFDAAEDRTRGIREAIQRVVSPPPPAPKQSEPSQTASAHTPSVQHIRFLRPPGALPEEAFAQTCSRCGDCVRVCPAQCIDLVSTLAGGLPHIIARESPCVICSDLSCMKACPTGALKLVESVSQIEMGVAVVDVTRCLRGESGQREDCRLCVTSCPVGESALSLTSQGIVEVREGCVGCGVCERSCPTEPASIWVEPR